MDEPIPVTIPLINPNEPEALLADLYVNEGQEVQAGDPLCNLETTKGAADVEAEASGYIAGLRYRKGDLVPAGSVLCFLAPSPDWSPGAQPTDGRPDGLLSEGIHGSMPPGLRITEPALAFARSRGIDLSRLPAGPLVTESLLKNLLDAPEAAQAEARSAFEANSLLLYGAGGHGKMLVALLELQGYYRIHGFLDDGLAPGASIMGIPVLGGANLLPELYAQGLRLAVNAVGGIGNVGVRIKVFERLAQAGFAFPAVTHPTALVEPGAELEPGSQVMAMAYVGPEARVGFGSIVNTRATVSHDCRLAEYVAISPGAVLAGAVQVGRGALIGMGATVNYAVKVGAGAKIGNGATVKADVPENAIVRAGTIWPER